MADTLNEYSSTSGPPPELDARVSFDTRRAIGCILAYVDEERREQTRFNDLNARAVRALLDDWWRLRYVPFATADGVSAEEMVSRGRMLADQGTERAYGMQDEEHVGAREDSSLMARMAHYIDSLLDGVVFVEGTTVPAGYAAPKDGGTA